jgi:hypothetical protein
MNHLATRLGRARRIRLRGRADTRKSSGWRACPSTCSPDGAAANQPRSAAREWPCAAGLRQPGADLAAPVRRYPAVQPYHGAVDHTVPPDAHGGDDDYGGVFMAGSLENGGFFFGIRKGSPEKAAYLAALRERFGAETVDRFQRDLELMRHPRPLTESEREVIRKAMGPVLRDLEVSGAIVPGVRYESSGDDGREGVSAVITPDGHGGSVWIPTEECSFAVQVCSAAEQLQEWEVHQLWQAGRSTTWPECPEHPNSHPLEPDINGEDAAVWACPGSKHIICDIGALGSRE